MSKPLIEIKNLSAGINGKQILKGINLTVRPGEVHAIMGPNGSGKSTLMNLLGCLDTPTSGSYVLGGAETASLSENELARVRAQKLGFIFQQYSAI